MVSFGYQYNPIEFEKNNDRELYGCSFIRTNESLLAFSENIKSSLRMAEKFNSIEYIFKRNFQNATFLGYLEKKVNHNINLEYYSDAFNTQWTQG